MMINFIYDYNQENNGINECQKDKISLFNIFRNGIC